jgi:hypothetical protein
MGMPPGANEGAGSTGLRNPAPGPCVGTNGRCRSVVLAILGLLGLTLAMFGDVLFSTEQRVLSAAGLDLSAQFLPWYEFGFGELRKGNLPLWNPHLFSGLPFFGGFQSALLYPPNLLYLVLPIAAAVNVLIALHILLIGLFMFLWASHRRLHPIACFVTAALLMFSGPHFLHLYPGHLPLLLTAAWIPLAFLSIDAFIATRRLGWCLAGMAAIAMMLLAGSQQYVFRTVVAAATYTLFRLAGVQRRLPAAAGLIAMLAGAGALTAAQLLPGAVATTESVRGRSLPQFFAATFSLPPENMLTLLAPGFFGDMTTFSYWGKSYLWEMSLFFGVTGLVLAICGLVYGDRSARRVSLSMVLIMLLLALGSHTPLFGLLHSVVPGFDRFRGNSKFIFHAALFLTLLAGIGLDGLLRTRRRPAGLPAFLVAAGATLALTATVLLRPDASGAPPPWWQVFMQGIQNSGESYLAPEIYADPAFVSHAAAAALGGLQIAAGMLLLLAALLYATRYGRPAVYALAVLAVAEVLFFARASLTTFDLQATKHPSAERVLKENPGDYRILNLLDPNAATSLGAYDIWGYAWGVSLRYAEFIAFTQGLDPDSATQNIELAGGNPLYRMLRLRYVFLPRETGMQVRELEGHLQHLLLVQNARVIQGRDRIFAALGGDFDPSSQVILESPPWPQPVPSDNKGSARIVAADSDQLTIEADVPSPSILVITDGYSPGWRAVALEGSVQRSYQVMPANYILRAVPLGTGHHRLRVEYHPAGFVVGAWISCVATLVFLALVALVALVAWDRRRQRAVLEGRPPAA